MVVPYSIIESIIEVSHIIIASLFSLPSRASRRQKEIARRTYEYEYAKKEAVHIKKEMETESLRFVPDVEKRLRHEERVIRSCEAEHDYYESVRKCSWLYLLWLPFGCLLAWM